MFANVNGTRLFFDVDGSSYVPEGPTMIKRPVCIVLHGGPGSDHSDFKPWFNELTKHMQIIYLDQRSNGQSERVDPSTCTLEQLADDIEEFRKYIGLEKFILLGHSFGGMVAQVYATKYPDSIDKLILVCTAPSYDFYRDALLFAQNIATADQLELIPKLFEGRIQNEQELEDWWTECFSLYYYKQDEQLMFETGNRPIGSLDVSNYTFKHFMPKYDVTEQIRNFNKPVYIAAGRHDWITPVSQAKVMDSLYPNSDLTIFEESGHMPFIEEQEKFLTSLLSFLQRVQS